MRRGLGRVRKALGQLQPNGVRNVLIIGETGTGKELVAEAVAQGFADSLTSFASWSRQT